jgi:hypothetical protein
MVLDETNTLVPHNAGGGERTNEHCRTPSAYGVTMFFSDVKTDRKPRFDAGVLRPSPWKIGDEVHVKT